MNRLKWNVSPTKRFLICARAPGSETKQPQDRCTPGLFVSGPTIEDIVGGNATLAIRRASERNQRPLVRDSIPHLNGIAHCPDVRVAGLEVFVDSDATQFTDFQTGILCQTRFRLYTQSEHDRIGGQSLTAFQHHDGSASPVHARKAARMMQRHHSDARQTPLARNSACSQAAISGSSGHYLWQRFYHSHLEPATPQLLGHFESNVTASDYDGAAALAVF
jgi:hypothetical protein